MQMGIHGPHIVHLLIILPESYSLSNSFATEGNTFTFYLSTTSVNNGTTLYYDIVAGGFGKYTNCGRFLSITIDNEFIHKLLIFIIVPVSIFAKNDGI